MKRSLCLLILAASLLSPRLARAQDPLGRVAANLSFALSKLLADPVRTRVYAAVPATNSIAVIDTTTLQVVATVPIASDPVDMAISMDGNTLYVANNGSPLAAVAVLDLNALTVTTNFALPHAPVAIAAGLGGRLYVSASPDGFSTAIYQLDSATGTVQTTFNSGDYDNNLFALSPDGTTLFEANNSEEPGTLKSFDVSTATPAALQVANDVSTFPTQLVVSHTGKYLCLPNYGSSTLLYSTADITSHYGSFNSNGASGPLAFSLDDSLVYQASGTVLNVFSTRTFTTVNTATLPTSG